MRTIYQALLVGSAFLALVSIVLSLSLFGTKLEGVFALPLCFIVFVALIGSVTWGRMPSPFLSICFATAFLRYVGFPALAAILGGYEGRSWSPPADESYDLAVVLMCYEILVVGALIVLLERRYQNTSRPAVPVTARTLPAWYLLGVGLAAMTLVWLFPQSQYLLSFGPFGVDTDEMLFPATATLAAMVLLATKVLIFVKLMHMLATRRRGSIFVPWWALMLGGLNILIYFGTGRIAVVLSAVATIWLMAELFGKRVTVPIGVLVVLAAFTFTTLTERRAYVQYSHNPLMNLADTVQAYTGGVYNVAIGIEVADAYPEARNISGLLFDFARPTVGLNLIVQDWALLYSNVYFNWRMFTHVDRRSQIIPMIAQGNLYFYGPLSPLLSLFFVWLGYSLQRLIWTVEFVELKYALFIVVLRLGFFWGQNSMNMMSFMSLHLILPVLLIVAYVFASGLGKSSARLNAPKAKEKLV